MKKTEGYFCYSVHPIRKLGPLGRVVKTSLYPKGNLTLLTGKLSDLRAPASEFVLFQF